MGQKLHWMFPALDPTGLVVNDLCSAIPVAFSGQTHSADIFHATYIVASHRCCLNNSSASVWRHLTTPRPTYHGEHISQTSVDNATIPKGSLHCTSAGKAGKIMELYHMVF